MTASAKAAGKMKNVFTDLRLDVTVIREYFIIADCCIFDISFSNFILIYYSFDFERELFFKKILCNSKSKNFNRRKKKCKQNFYFPFSSELHIQRYF